MFVYIHPDMGVKRQCILPAFYLTRESYPTAVVASRKTLPCLTKDLTAFNSVHEPRVVSRAAQPSRQRWRPQADTLDTRHLITLSCGGTTWLFRLPRGERSSRPCNHDGILRNGGRPQGARQDGISYDVLLKPVIVEGRDHGGAPAGNPPL